MRPPWTAPQCLGEGACKDFRGSLGRPPFFSRPGPGIEPALCPSALSYRQTVDARPPPGGWISWAEVGPAGGGEPAGRGGGEGGEAAGPTSPWAPALPPACGRGCFFAFETNLGWKAEGGKANSFIPLPCGWRWASRTSFQGLNLYTEVQNIDH